MKRLRKRITDILWIVFNISCWTRVYSYNKDWDNKLISLMEQHKFVVIDKFWARLGDTKIWVVNHPFASFRRGFGMNHTLDVMPSRITVRNAMRKLVQDIIEREE